MKKIIFYTVCLFFIANLYMVNAVETKQSGKKSTKTSKSTTKVEKQNASTTKATPSPDIAKSATNQTIEANNKIKAMLPFESDKKDFEDAQFGLIEKTTNLQINAKNSDRIIWDLNKYNFLQKDFSDTINPSLYRQAQLNMNVGLYKVAEHIYQIRGFDISNMTIIETSNGYIIVDPLTYEELSSAALELFFKHKEKKPIKAVIFTHSHVDHFGGIKGVVSDEDVASGKIKIIAPSGFLENAADENILAGNAMMRRATYMYGIFLGQGEQGQVDAGIGKGSPTSGSMSLMKPTDIISKDGETLTIDGLKIEFMLANGSEAPAEFVFYIPQYKAFCNSEIAVHSMHNIYTIRGAKVRDSYAWSVYLDNALVRYADKSDVMFASHNWPTWGKENIKQLLSDQRDMYKFMHDQTLRLANEGYTMDEIAEMITLPKNLANKFYLRGYYGTLKHNSKAIYNKYLGYYNADPATLNPLTDKESAKKYVDYMGGANNIIAKAKVDYANGNYRWVAQVMRNVVFADPKNMEARNLEADALEQLGYQAESSTWRNAYLTGAYELRNGVSPNLPSIKQDRDVIYQLTPESIFQAYSVTIDPDRSTKNISINWELTDTKEKFNTQISNGVLIFSNNYERDIPNATIILSSSSFYDGLYNLANAKAMIENKEIIVNGSLDDVKYFFSLAKKPKFWFNISLPR